jgi:hypothetical protein
MGSELKELLLNFTKVTCPIHRQRTFDHLCTLPSCTEGKVLFCAKCLIEDEAHVLRHKTHFKQLEQYLVGKIEELSGA